MNKEGATRERLEMAASIAEKLELNRMQARREILRAAADTVEKLARGEKASWAEQSGVLWARAMLLPTWPDEPEVRRLSAALEMAEAALGTGFLRRPELFVRNSDTTVSSLPLGKAGASE